MSKLEKDFDFDREIKILDNYSPDKKAPFESIINICQRYLCQLHKEIVTRVFESVKSEINFFKVTKQQPLQTFIYCSKLKTFEAGFPKGNKTKQQKFILANIKELNSFFQRNLEFSQYLKMELNHFDEFYFTRKHFSDAQTLFNEPFFRDPEFSTSHDLLLAKHNANYRLLRYLENRLYHLKNSNFKKLSTSELNWTSSKVALTELTYALYHGGAINNGNSDIIEIANALQQTFNFPIRDLYRTYTEIRLRKNKRTKFLDELSISLLNGMESKEK